jgi:hypothetical protein
MLLCSDDLDVLYFLVDVLRRCGLHIPLSGKDVVYVCSTFRQMFIFVSASFFHAGSKAVNDVDVHSDLARERAWNAEAGGLASDIGISLPIH